ncbi:Oidioi.mRNA.OKI2018_I69.chr2.g7203.t2.cds [Oikopleura dioica]|uniref:sphingomyelin phosphodiesterase n=1 Tax=Oikopleura dioica TaxID=34765 RepID=A0ABN7T622_OIKDI|nr:Oidioi.mRNA.OKI2018_I69.chr2.g7203.t2.cds [Oikopleura dioica]
MDKILHSKSDKTVVQQVRELPDLTTNISEAKENEIMRKRRPLKLTIANLSAKDTLSVKNEWFKTGKFFNHPVDTIAPGQKLTFYCVNTDGFHLAGLSGGVAVEVKSKKRRDEYLICTFFNPLVGCIKSSMFLSTESGDDQIQALWEPMMECAVVKESFYGSYRESDKHIIFVWKDSNINWSAHVSSIAPEAPPEDVLKRESKTISVFTNNTCLMPEGLSRVNNLPYTLERATQIGDILLNPSGKRHDEIINEDIPDDLDVICLQEVFNEDAWKILNDKLRSKYPYILFDAHRVRVTNFKFSMVNSGLYIASKYPIVQSKFYPFKNSYAEDALSGKGLLCAEIRIGEKTSIIIANTHMQAPTASFVKSSATRTEQYKEMEDYMSEFGDMAELEVQAEIITGDFNTDPRSPIDDACLKSQIFEDFRDPLAHCELGSCLKVVASRLEEVQTPSGLKQVLLDKDPKFIWSSSKLNKDTGEVESLDNGCTRFDYILILPHTPKPISVTAQFHTKLAGLTDHVPISAVLSLQS